MYTKIPKPTGPTYTTTNSFRYKYDEPTLLYDDPIALYDGVSINYTKISKPNSQFYTNITKPS